ncbi:transposase [Telmatocola sphagniphila]|uniref:Transposase n=1 Tax=Telmatocola sphagniphila TaxID=1123043 RepID=A0A8E6B9T2_9BACT|nr:transposase [Telmatocola sphagniphila]QVL33909.1 transposase [Telmatocola sphagniphila]
MEKLKVKRRRKRYSAEYKKAAVELVTVTGQSPAEAAKSLGVTSQTIKRWIDELTKLGEKASQRKTAKLPGHNHLEDHRRLMR